MSSFRAVRDVPTYCKECGRELEPRTRRYGDKEYVYLSCPKTKGILGYLLTTFSSNHSDIYVRHDELTGKFDAYTGTKL